MVNIIFSILAVILLGVINQINGFKHVFRLRGLGKGLIVLIPVMAFFLLGLSLAINAMEYMNVSIEEIKVFPAIIFMQITSAFMQNVIFRGLLVTALLIKFSNTKSERVKGVFMASALYLIIYIPFNILSGSIDLMQLINTFVIGAGFCAAYLYSKNLLSIILTQGIWQILSSGVNLFGVEGYPQSTPFAAAALIVIILIMIVVLTVVFSRRAEHFHLR
ncbi:MAG: hypothetical protein FWE24_07690 [Defluviitaleaceae bacterium]|nr:hypothetical protein [Defluviitaleaceae bacterium]